MSNLRDFHNLPITTDSDVAAEAFNRTIASYLKYRIDTPDHLKATLEADPKFALAHCCRGYFTLLTYKQANVAAAKQAHQAASEALQGASPREHAHVTALGNWIAGDLDRTIAIWEEILADHPTDVLAMRLAHFNNFWLGRPEAMRKAIERIKRHWGASLPGYGTLLACSAFAHEECGDYETAERHGRAAVEIDAADVWATHAVAHVFEMQGRRDEGIAWLGQLEPNWTSTHNIVHHLWWHRALLHLEQSEIDAVLDLYDRHFRNLAAPLVVAQPDLYIDIQNAASMLFRLERHGVDVGDRWTEIAEKAEARIGDCLSVFTLPHWLMALAAAGRDAAANRMLDAMRSYGNTGATTARIVRDIAVPICEAVLAHRRADYERAIERMRPVLPSMHALGGSHAQQDVLEQLFLDAAIKGNRPDDVRILLRRAGACHPVPPARRIGYAEAAERFIH